MAFCTECGANVPEGVNFCTECGKPITVAVAAAPPVVQAEPVAPPVAPQPVAPPPVYTAPQPVYTAPPQYAAPGIDSPVVGTGAFFGLLILFAIPIIGWLACIIMAFASKNRNIKHFARAELILLIIGVVLSVVTYFVFSWIIGAALEYFNEYMSEATGGDFSGLGGLKDILNLLK
jgi:hypothetical protein